MSVQDAEELRALLKLVGIKRHGEQWKNRLAKDLGCDRSTITLWEQGKRGFSSFSADRIRRMAKAEGIKKAASKHN